MAMRLNCFTLAPPHGARSLAPVLVIAAALFSIAPIATAAEAEDSPNAVLSEIQTMTRVLEAALRGEKLIGEHRIHVGVSPFERGVEGRYLPTVGALFTVRLNFPLDPPPLEAEEPTDEGPGESKDLWEEMSSAQGGAAQHSARAFALQGDQDRQIQVHVPPKISQRVIVEGERNAAEHRLRQAERMRDRYLKNEGRRGAAVPFLWQGDWSQQIDLANLMFGGGAPYEAERVETFREVLFAAIGKYAHRMEHLPDNERILVTVVAPKARTQSKELHATGGIGPGGGIEMIITGGHRAGDFERSTRVLYAFKKSDLRRERSREETAGATKEHRY